MIDDKKSSNEVNSLINQKVLKMDGYEIHYNISGNKNNDVIMLLHPAFSDHRAFNNQIDYFSTSYKVITIDLIGHGLSKANKSKHKIDASSEHIFKILQEEKVDKVHLVGVSMGSLIAQYFALEYPERIQTLTALGGYNINKENKEVAKAQLSSNISLLIRAFFSMDSFRRKTAEVTCQSKIGKALFYESSSLYERKSFMVMAGFENIIKDRKNIEPTYPLLILTGEFDIDLTKKMAKKWKTESINSKFSIIKEAGHCANIDNPKEFNAVVKDFIDMN